MNRNRSKTSGLSDRYTDGERKGVETRREIDNVKDRLATAT